MDLRVRENIQHKFIKSIKEQMDAEVKLKMETLYNRHAQLLEPIIKELTSNDVQKIMVIAILRKKFETSEDGRKFVRTTKDITNYATSLDEEQQKVASWAVRKYFTEQKIRAQVRFKDVMNKFYALLYFYIPSGVYITDADEKLENRITRMENFLATHIAYSPLGAGFEEAEEDYAGYLDE